MRIIIEAKNLELTQGLRDFIEKKFSSLEKITIPNAEVFVEIEKETMHHHKGKIFSAKAQVQVPGKMLLAKSEQDDMYKAIVGAKDELKVEIEKRKLKKIDTNRRQQRKAKDKIIA
jgi:putative sigma-54 modulation protein